MPKTLISDTIKNVYQKIIFYLTSDNKLYKTTEDGNNDDIEINTIANSLTFTASNTFSNTSNLNGAVILNGQISGAFVQDDDTFSSPSATKIATSESIKAYSLTGTQILTNKTLTSPTLQTATILNGTITGTCVDTNLAVVGVNTLASAVAIKNLVDSRGPASNIITMAGSENGVKFLGEDTKSAIIFMMLGDLSKYALVYINFLSAGNTQFMFGSPMSTGISSHSNSASTSQYIGFTSSDKLFWHRIGGDSDVVGTAVTLIP